MPRKRSRAGRRRYPANNPDPFLKKYLPKLDNFFFGRFKDHYVKALGKELDGCTSVLDVGCGSASPLRHFKGTIEYSVGVDSFRSSIDQSRAAGIHHEYALMNALDISGRFPNGSFDCVVALDVLEHLTKDDGHKLLRMMERIARKKIIIFAPNGFVEQGGINGNLDQVHLSGWGVGEMRRMGYRVTGINGWKLLRGELARVRGWPGDFWWRISLLSEYITTHCPEHAFALLCVKEKRAEEP